jgi:hypothetical protein
MPAAAFGSSFSPSSHGTTTSQTTLNPSSTVFEPRTPSPSPLRFGGNGLGMAAADGNAWAVDSPLFATPHYKGYPAHHGGGGGGGGPHRQSPDFYNGAGKQRYGGNRRRHQHQQLQGYLHQYSPVNVGMGYEQASILKVHDELPAQAIQAWNLYLTRRD